MEQRKGAKNMASIPAEILAALNNGSMPSANLVEWLAVDSNVLLQNVLQQWGMLHLLNHHAVPSLHGISINKRNASLGKWLAQAAEEEPQLLNLAAQHTSDSVRGWACYAIAVLHASQIDGLLNAMQPLANDAHFGVREMAWMAARPAVVHHWDEAYDILLQWVQHPSENIRRFATEISRPRGVWCLHIQFLKDEPWKALELLNHVKADPSRYVQNSVANWLNDASKSQPQWVLSLLSQWLEESPSPATVYICKRGMRGVLARKELKV